MSLPVYQLMLALVALTDSAITSYFGKDALIRCASGYLTEVLLRPHL